MCLSLRLTRFLCNQESFLTRHKKSTKVFTRQRKLPFLTVLKFLLSKSIKSLQLRLNELSDFLKYDVTASAFCQARQKLSHTAFIELLEKSVVKVMYKDGDYKKYKDRRLLAIDGSTLRLPKSKEILLAYGQSRKGNEKLVEGKLSVVYDLLNNVPLSAVLHPGRTNDITGCKEQLELISKEDIIIADRGYDSYEFFIDIIEKKADFIIRCRLNRGICKELNDDPERKDVTISLPAPENKKDIPQTLQVRFLRIVLPSGEVEILATSLTDKKLFSYNCFKKLYEKRWGIETYFHTLKSRLGLDNFSGRTVESVLQDLHSTIFVSGLATILAEEANIKLLSKETRYTQKTNNAVLFHSLKHKIINLIFEDPPDFEEQVMKLFIKNPTLIRRNREKERKYYFYTASGKTRSLFFQKHLRKHVF